MPEIEVGKVSAFFARPVVAGIDLTSTVKVGDKVHIKGHTTDVEVTIESMQIHNVNVQEAKSGDSIGIKVPDRVRPGDHVYKITRMSLHRTIRLLSAPSATGLLLLCPGLPSQWRALQPASRSCLTLCPPSLWPAPGYQR